MKVKAFISGFVVGSFAAGISTLLTAPNSGNHTRKRIKATNKNLLSHLNELKTNLSQLKDSALYATKEGKTQITNFLHEIKTSLADWEKDILPQQQNLQREITEIKDSVTQLEEKINSGK